MLNITSASVHAFLYHIIKYYHLFVALCTIFYQLLQLSSNIYIILLESVRRFTGRNPHSSHAGPYIVVTGCSLGGGSSCYKTEQLTVQYNGQQLNSTTFNKSTYAKPSNQWSCTCGIIPILFSFSLYF